MYVVKAQTVKSKTTNQYVLVLEVKFDIKIYNKIFKTEMHIDFFLHIFAENYVYRIHW